MRFYSREGAGKKGPLSLHPPISCQPSPLAKHLLEARGQGSISAPFCRCRSLGHGAAGQRQRMGVGRGGRERATITSA